MGFSAIQIILVFVWTFIIAIDQFDFLESLYQPIVSGAVIGETIDSAAFKFRVADVKFRIKIVDEHGKCAYSKIYDIPEDTPRVGAEAK